MKKSIAIIAALLVAGCSQEKQLTFHVGGTPDELAYWEELAADWLSPSGMKVQLLRSTTQTEQRKQSILVALRGRKSDPDVMLMDVAWIGQMAQSEWLEPLGPLGVSTDNLFERVVKLADTHDGQVVGVPLYVDGGMLYYRTDLLEKYGYDGPPETWLELEEMSTKVQKGERAEHPDFWGYVWQGAQYEGLVCNALEWFVSAGGGLLDDDLQPIVNSDENIGALTAICGFVSKGGISPPNTYTDMKEEEVRQVFHNGSALFERNWPYARALHNADDSPVKGKVGIAPLPHFEGHTSASTLGGWHVAVSRFSDCKEDAAAFVSYVMSAEVQKQLALDLGWNPGNAAVYDDRELADADPDLARLRAVFENAVPRPTVPYYSEISLVLQRELNAALAGRKGPKMALDAAQKEVGEIVQRYRQ